MKIEYSKEVDALYIRLREARIEDSMDIEEGVLTLMKKAILWA